MAIQPEILIPALHICLALVYLAFVLFRFSHLRIEQIIPLCFIPIFGLLLAMTIDLLIFLRKEGLKEPELEAQGLGNDILWTTLKNTHEKGDLVPLEEVILIDEVTIRRKSMLETLYTDPVKYLGVLNTAKYNDDIETSHYATTTISKSQKDFQLSIQKYELKMERHPDDPDVLDAYIETLGKYIRSNLLEEGLLRNIRIAYSQVLDKKLALMPNDMYALTEKLRNAVELQDFGCASKIGELLIQNWPEDEQSWIEMLRVYVEGKDKNGLQRSIEAMRNRQILWTAQGREQVSPWLN